MKLNEVVQTWAYVVAVYRSSAQDVVKCDDERSMIISTLPLTTFLREIQEKESNGTLWPAERAFRPIEIRWVVKHPFIGLFTESVDGLTFYGRIVAVGLTPYDEDNEPSGVVIDWKPHQ